MIFMIRRILIEFAAAAVFIIPFFLILNFKHLHSWKRTAFYTVFAFYLTAVLVLVGFPNVLTIRIDVGINLIPFLDMIPDIKNACLNVLLFIPFGFFLPFLWIDFQNKQRTVLTGFAASCAIELSQIFSFRTTDINDLITNTLGAFIGYCVAMKFTNNFSVHVVSARDKRDFCIICIAVSTIMFFLQPFVSFFLWDMIL